jgi:dihydrofolate reductase
MKAVIACDPKGGIGYENKLPWSKIKGDLPRLGEINDSILDSSRIFYSVRLALW